MEYIFSIGGEYLSFRFVNKDKNFLKNLKNYYNKFICKIPSRVIPKQNFYSQQNNIYSFDSFLRIFYSRYLCEYKKGFLIHAAGIGYNNFSYIFSGESESGKSTLMKIFMKDRTNKLYYLSDEIILIKKHKDNNFYSYSTPFWGGLKKPQNVENLSFYVSKIFFINKSSENYIEEINFDETIRLILKNIIFFHPADNYSNKETNFVGLFWNNKVSVNKLLEITQEFCMKVKCYKLFFNKSFKFNLIKL